MNDEEYIKKIKMRLSRGGYMSFRGVTICPIKRNMPKQIVYQVHSDNPKTRFSKLYKDIDEAIQKFLQIKKKVRR